MLQDGVSGRIKRKPKGFGSNAQLTTTGLTQLKL